ncbi:hypothetical protein GCM10020219_088030 [Nonomuraea dietziae]
MLRMDGAGRTRRGVAWTSGAVGDEALGADTADGLGLWSALLADGTRGGGRAGADDVGKTSGGCGPLGVGLWMDKLGWMGGAADGRRRRMSGGVGDGVSESKAGDGPAGECGES